MRDAVTEDEVEALEMTARTPEERRQAAARLLDWAGEPNPDDAVDPAALLVSAAMHLDHAGDPDGALATLRRAVTADGVALPDARCHLHMELLRQGHAEEARALAEEIRRSAPDDPDVYGFVAENYEVAGDLPQAMRWVALGERCVERIDPSGAIWTEQAWLLVHTRRRIREKAGFPPDDLDALA